MNVKKVLLFQAFILLFWGCEKEVVQKQLTLRPSPKEGKDAIIAKAYPERSYGEFKMLHLLSRELGDSVDDDNRFFISFKLNSIAKEITIDSSFIYLYANKTKHLGENAFFIERVTYPWSEDGVNWESMPTVNDSIQVAVEKSKTPDQNYKIDVTPLMREIVRTKKNYGLMFRLQDETPPIKRLTFHSSNSLDSLKRPKLTLFYKEKN